MNTDKIRCEIEESGYSIKEFCRLLNISVSAFTKRMSGKREFKMSEISRIIELLNIPKTKVEEYFF